jgi:hypothetical protein
VDRAEHRPGPEEYRELFRAARLLFEEGISAEELIIPTLAFAAYSWEKPGLAYLKDELWEAAVGSERWEDLRNFFLNTSLP